MPRVRRTRWTSASTSAKGPSEIALPKLLEQERTFDFAFIDGFHTFDHTLLDFFYLNRLLRVGGLIVIDDVSLPPINKVGRYVTNYPCYELAGVVPTEPSPQRSVLNALKGVLHTLARLIPTHHIYEVLDDSVLHPNRSLGLDASMVALQKTAPDERGTFWFVPF